MTTEEIIAIYRALPPQTTTLAAKAIGVGLSTLQKALAAAGLTQPTKFTVDAAADAQIAKRYRALPPGLSLVRAAEALGIGSGRLLGALDRTRTPRTPPPVVIPPKPLRTPRRGPDALPPGSPETWGVLGWGPYPCD